jgi:anion-transporting  ArsA/GET3 family ATPase
MRVGTHTRLYSQAPGEILRGRRPNRSIFKAVPELLKRRLIFVTGKGGVGKSTVATSLGVLAARRGLRVIVAELASQDRVRQALSPSDSDSGSQSGSDSAKTFVEVEISDGLFTISIDPQSAMEEYLRVKSGALGQALGSSRLFGAFAMATPGMRELLSIGKVWELAQFERRTSGAEPYDLVIVDSPAAGHGVGILRTPKMFAEIARVGPIAHQARTIAATIANPDFTAVVAVATPEEMPVNETLWLRDALAEDELELEAVIVNGCYPERFRAVDRKRLEKARENAKTPLGSGALRAALSEQARVRAQREQLQRLGDGLGAELVTLPSLFCEEIGRPELELLANGLETGLAKLQSVAA